MRLKGTNPQVPSSPRLAESWFHGPQSLAESSCGDASDPALPASLTLKFSHLTSPFFLGGSGSLRCQPWFSAPVWWPRGEPGCSQHLVPLHGRLQADEQPSWPRKGSLESEDPMGRAAMPHPTSGVTMGKSQNLSEPQSLFCQRVTTVLLLSGGCERR